MPPPLQQHRWRHLLQVPDGMVRSSAASAAASGGVQLTCLLDTRTSSGSTVDSPPGDGHAGRGGEAPSGRPATVAMQSRTESQDMAAAADLITTLSRGGAAQQGDAQLQVPAAAVVAAPVALPPPAATAPRLPLWEGMLPAPDARMASASATPAAATPLAAAAVPAAATATVASPRTSSAARNRSPYARRGSQIPLGDRPPPKPASSVKFSRRNAPYVCQVIAS